MTPWLAVLAILLQTILPDFGMAARARAQAQTAAAEQLLHHEHAAETPLPDEPPSHEHGPVCPFCLALSAHALAPESGEALAAPDLRASGDRQFGAGIVPALPFLTCLRPRAPPHADRA